jgi:peptidase M28-like protein
MGTLAVLACQADDESSRGSGPSTGAGAGEPQGPSGLEQAEIQRRVSALAADEMEGRDEGTPGGAMARAYVIDELEKCGVKPAVGTSFEQPIAGGAGTNVIGVVPGTDPALAARHVLVSAHYDHLGICDGDICNGAEDNAAGVAIVLGVACEMAAHPAARSLLVVAWDAEEPPTFLTPQMGSQFYTASPVVPLEQIDVAIALDLVGGALWPGFAGHFVLGAELSPQVAAAVDAVPVPQGLLALRSGLHLAEEQPIGHQPWSDYDAFRNLQKPVLFLSNGQSKHYHTAGDEVGNLDLPKMALEAQYLYEVVKNLASAADTPVFDGAGSDYATDVATLKVIIEAALAPGGMVDALGLKPTSRAKLEADLADIAAIGDAITQGMPPSTADVRRLRDGAQHMMCYASSIWAEASCNGF